MVAKDTLVNKKSITLFGVTVDLLGSTMLSAWNKLLSETKIILDEKNLSDHLPLQIKYNIDEKEDAPIHKSEKLKPRIKYNYENLKFLKNFVQRANIRGMSFNVHLKCYTVY